VIGLDWRVNLDEAWKRRYDVAQGNLDPSRSMHRRRKSKPLAEILPALARPGHIFNLAMCLPRPLVTCIAMSKRSRVIAREEGNWILRENCKDKFKDSGLIPVLD